MSNVTFARGLSTNLNKRTLRDGQLLVTTDDRRLYLDTFTQRIPITGDPFGKLVYLRVEGPKTINDTETIEKYYLSNSSSSTPNDLKNLITNDSMIFIDNVGDIYGVAQTESSITLQFDSPIENGTVIFLPVFITNIFADTNNFTPVEKSGFVSIEKYLYASNWVKENDRYIQTIDSLFAGVDIAEKGVIVVLNDDFIENSTEYSQVVLKEVQESSITFSTKIKPSFNIGLNILTRIGTNDAAYEVKIDKINNVSSLSILTEEGAFSNNDNYICYFISGDKEAYNNIKEIVKPESGAGVVVKFNNPTSSVEGFTIGIMFEKEELFKIEEITLNSSDWVPT